MTEEPQKPPPPGSGTAARQGVVSGRVVLVLAISTILVVLGMVGAYFWW